MKRLFGIAVLFTASFLLGGCATMSKDMAISKEQKVQPAPGKALVVFFRDAFFGKVIQSTVYEANDANSIKFIGIVSNETKVAYQADPGDHMFMVESEAADFAAAHLVAGKTYYILVEPRMGVWKARFSLEPIHKAPGKYSLQSPDFSKWMEETQFVEPTSSAETWYESNKDDIQGKYNKYINDWKTTDQPDRDEHTLQADDSN